MYFQATVTNRSGWNQDQMKTYTANLDLKDLPDFLNDLIHYELTCVDIKLWNQIRLDRITGKVKQGKLDI